MKTSSYLKLSIVSALAVALVVIWLAGSWWPAASAHGVSSTHSHSSPHTFEESGGQLKLTVDASILGGTLVLNDEGQAIWQYVGPSATDELDACNELGWSELEDKARDIQAEVETADGDPTKASVTLALRPDAGINTRYCFNIPIQTESGVVPYVLIHILEEVSIEVDSTLIFRPSAPSPLDASGVPASISVTVPAGTDIESDSWQYATVGHPDDCRVEEEIDFLPSSADNQTLGLQPKDAGTVFCFRVALAGSEGGFLYKAYQVPTAADGEQAGDNETDTGGMSWIFIVLAVGVAGVIIVVIVRSVQSKR